MFALNNRCTRLQLLYAIGSEGASFEHLGDAALSYFNVCDQRKQRFHRLMMLPSVRTIDAVAGFFCAVCLVESEERLKASESAWRRPSLDSSNFACSKIGLRSQPNGPNLLARCTGADG